MRSNIRFLLPACLVLLVMALGTQAWAQRFSRNLEKIRSSDKGDIVEFVFSHPYQGKPRLEHKAGEFRVIFGQVGYQRKDRVLKPKDQSLYKEFKVTQNRYSTSVAFTLRDAKQQLKNRLRFDGKGKTLRMTISGSPAAPPLSPQARKDQELLQRQMGKRNAGQAPTHPAVAPSPPIATPHPAAPPPAKSSSPGESGLTLGGLGGAEFFLSMVKMVLALMVIIGALYGVLFLYNRYYQPRLRRLTGSQAITQIASFHIGPRQRIVVLEIKGEVVACGVTPNQITYLTHLGGGPETGNKAPPPIPKELAKAVSEGGTEAADAEDNGASSADGKSDPVHQFAQVLKQKVRSLKRIN